MMFVIYSILMIRGLNFGVTLSHRYSLFTTMPQKQIGYCPRCDTDREIRVTVAWQSDFCTECGAEIDD